MDTTTNADKLFVAGVSWSTTDDAFKHFFAKFGEVTECQVMRDPSGRSRGFGFVVFANPDVKDQVLTQQLQLDGRKLDIKPAVSKEDIKSQAEPEENDSKKVWVAGLSYHTTDDSLFNYFAKYGQIEKASTMKDKLTGKSRGFAFVCFVSQDVTDEVLKMTDLELDGRRLEVKMAVARGGTTQSTPKKCYVAGLNEDTSDETFRAHFDQFGTVTDAFIQKGKDQKSRGFGFVTYETEVGSGKAIAHPEHIIDGKKVDCKAAVPRAAERPAFGGRAAAAGGGMQAMQAAAMQRMATARQFQAMQFQAMQAQAMQAQAQAASAQAMQAQAAQAAYAAAAARAQPQATQAYPGNFIAAASALLVLFSFRVVSFAFSCFFLVCSVFSPIFALVVMCRTIRSCRHSPRLWNEPTDERGYEPKC